MVPSVLLIIFNRFDTTRQVLESLRIAGVKNLYIYSDGPRESVSGELEQLKKVQLQVLSEINWPCQVTTNFESTNLGPRLAIGKGISWFFSLVEEGIILEHDCVPNQTFYRFCSELLERYRHDERIMHISGDNFQFGRKRGHASYFFSKYNYIWGFATWKRAWEKYDPEMKLYPEFKESGGILNIFSERRIARIWLEIFDKVHSGSLQTWDYQWTFAIWINNGLSVLPNVNLVRNVGFDSEALNTTNPNHYLANMETLEIDKITHPFFVLPDRDADNFAINNVFHPTLLKFAIYKLTGKI